MNDYMYQQKAESVRRIYKEGYMDLEMDIYNAAYKALVESNEDGFNQGWIEATIWAMGYFRDKGITFDSEFSDANIAAKQEYISKYYKPIK